MSLFRKNPDYVLCFVEPETGYGILFSNASEECVFLNPIAVAFWKTPLEVIDTDYHPQVFADSLGIKGASEYLATLMSDLHRRGLLLAPDELSPNGKVHQHQRQDTYRLGQLYLYVTSECNARCYHCYQPTKYVKDGPRPLQQGQVPREKILNLVEEAIPLGLQSVKITGGEPFIRADLDEIIRGVRALGLRVSIESNGSLIDDQIADLISEQEIYLSMSLDGGSAAVHDTLRRFPGSFDKVIRALKLLTEREHRAALIMAVSYRNLEEIENVVRIAAAYKCWLVKLNPVNTLGLARRLTSSHLLLAAEEIQSLHKKAKELESKYGVTVYVEGPPSFASIPEIISGHTAACPFTGILGLLPDGWLSFCGVGNSSPELKFAHIDDLGFNLRRFWESADPLVEVRKLLAERLEGVCSECILEPFCKGSCRALAYGEFKSFRAPDPWCQAAYDSGQFPSQYLRPNNKEVYYGRDRRASERVSGGS